MGFDAARYLTQAPARGALEQHVLVQVGEADLLGRLVRAPDLHPDLKGRDARGVLLFPDDEQAVGELEPEGHLKTS